MTDTNVTITPTISLIAKMGSLLMKRVSVPDGERAEVINGESGPGLCTGVYLTDEELEILVSSFGTPIDPQDFTRWERNAAVVDGEYSSHSYSKVEG